MALTTQEESFVKKLFEIEKARNQWNALSTQYLTAVRAATKAEETAQSTLRDQMSGKHSEKVSKEEELKTILGV
jgi:hypothetical protein